jgi:hypothetical protein
VINDAKLNQEEVKHGTFGGDDSVNLSGFVDFLLGIEGNEMLLLNLIGGLLSDLKGLNKGGVLKNGCWISIRKVLEKVFLKLGKSNFEFVLLFNEIISSLLKIGLLNTHDFSQKLILKT